MNFSAATVTKAFFQLKQLIFNETQNSFITFQYCLEILNEFLFFLVLLFHFQPLEICQLLEFHFKDRNRLPLRKLELLYEVRFRLIAITGLFDSLDDSIDLNERNTQAF